MAVEMCGVQGVAGEIVRGKYPLIELMPGGMYVHRLASRGALPRRIVRGAQLQLLRRPTHPPRRVASNREELEVIIATGTRPGPKLLLTGNIHGNEINPCIICHRIIEWLESAVADGSLAGSVIIMPSLNPTGHRAMTRSPSFESVDPNRYWPDGFAAPGKLSDELSKDTYADLCAHATPRTQPCTFLSLSSLTPLSSVPSVSSLSSRLNHQSLF